MVGSLYSGISGLKTQQFGIDTTANNLANVNTIGFRATNAEFKTLFANHLAGINANSPIANDYGNGATVGASSINSNDGTYMKADGEFNVAYKGRGWFVVGTNSNGTFDVLNPTLQQQNYFTRDGSFSRDADGYIVNSSGYYMYGINLHKIGEDGTFSASGSEQADLEALSGSTLEPIKIPQNLYYRPTVTTQVDMSLNLNRTQGAKPISILQNADGTFDTEKFRSLDFAALMDGNGKTLDAKNYNDFTITNSAGQSVTLTYNGTGENSFTTVGEFMDLINSQTPLNVSLNLNTNGTLASNALSFTAATMQDQTITLGGKLPGKLGLNGGEQKIGGVLSGTRSYQDGTDYTTGTLVEYKGVILRATADVTGNGSPLADTGNWEIVDSSGVSNFDTAKTYAEGDVVLLNGTLYERSANAVDPDASIVPGENADLWSEAGTAVNGSVPEYQAGTTYNTNDYVVYQGMVYQKIGDAGSESPTDDPTGWRRLTNSSFSTKTTNLQLPTFESSEEIYNEAGDKYTLRSTYILTQQGSGVGATNGVETWEVQTAIYDAQGKAMVSTAPVVSTITFDASGAVTAPIVNVPFDNGQIAVNYANSGAKPTTNYAYGDSELNDVTQDGVQEGRLSSVTIDDNGIIFANFTNGKMEPLGRFGLATFVNDQGLSQKGDNLFALDGRTVNGNLTLTSGAPILSWSDTNGQLLYGSVLGGYLEYGNLDTTNGITDLIVYQRAYQMSAKAITTSDSLLQEALNLKRN